MMRNCLILLLIPFFVGCETTSKKDEPIPEDEAITIPAEDLEPIATFVFDTRRVIAADYIRIELTSQFFESKMGTTRDLRYVERKSAVMKDGTRVILLRNRNKDQLTNIDADLLPRVYFDQGLELRAYSDIIIKLKSARTKNNPLYIDVRARSTGGDTKMWVGGRLEKQQPDLHIRSQLLWNDDRERYVHKPIIE
jgi:hypothetical protein